MRYALVLFVLLSVFSLQVSAFSFGGISIGTGSGNEEGSDLDVKRIFDVITHSNKAFSDISEEDEQIMGKEAAAVLLGTAPLLDNPKVQRYINTIGQWLASQTERPDLPWRFAVLETPSINAFATPGGYVFITSGILQVLADEAELAGVLAHEIAHVVRRHHALAIKSKNKTALAADIASIAAGDSGGLATVVLMDNIKNIYTKGLDKDDEFEADEVGVVIAARGGYDPYGLPSVLNTLDSIGEKDSRIQLWYSTHPPAMDRLDRLDEKMDGRFDDLAGQGQFAERFASHVSKN